MKLVAPVSDWKARGRRVLLRLQYSANRSTWISSTEAALYVHTEQQYWTSHNEVPLVLSRPLYLVWECKRILSSSKPIITRANAATHFSQITYEFQPPATAGDGPHLPARSETSTAVGAGIRLATAQSSRNAPALLHNIGNACYMNAFVAVLQTNSGEDAFPLVAPV